VGTVALVLMRFSPYESGKACIREDSKAARR
jgi:hypothetical protein